MAEPNKSPIKGTVKKVERLGVIELLFAGDIKTALQIAVKDVLGPKLQDILVNFADTVTRSFVYGDNYRSTYDNRSSNTNYKLISNGQMVSYQTKPADRYDQVAFAFQYYDDAKNAIAFIQESIAKYQVFTVLNFYDYTGQKTNPTDDRYGWTNIGDIRPEKTRDGWVIRLPKPMEIEKK